MFNNKTDLDKFIDSIILNPPKNKKSIYINFDNVDSNELFNNLLYIFKNILKKKYGSNNEKIDINTLNQIEIYELISYFESFGINLILKIYNIRDYSNYYDLNKIEDELFYSNTKKLNELTYKIIIKNKIMIIKFDYL